MKTSYLRITCCLFLLMMTLLIMPTANAALKNPNEAYLNSYIHEMEAQHESAFVSGCIAKSAGKFFLAKVVYFPRRNSGFFILRTKDGRLSNMGRISISKTGKWDLGDLEGGIDTFSILSNLFSQILRYKFAWVAPSDLGHVDKSRPQNTCRLLGNERT